MEEKIITSLKRHDLVVLSHKELDALCQEALTFYPKEMHSLIKEVFKLTHSYEMPGIVRRAEDIPLGKIPLGFVPLTRYLGQRLRVSTFANTENIKKTILPSKVLEKEIKNIRTNCLDTLAEIKAWNGKMDLGVLGSASLEIFTGLPYTNEDSDIDLVMGPHSLEELQIVYNYLINLGIKKNIKIDLEITLPNGYGIKAKELFVETTTILGKGMKDVVLLKRNDVETELNSL